MNRGTLIGTLSLTSLAVVLVIGTGITGVSAEQTPSITTVLGFIGLGISQFINVKNSTDSKTTTDQLSADLKNGTMERLVREAILKIANDDSTALHIVNDDKTDG